MASASRQNRQPALFTFIAILLVIAVLWVAQVVLIPLALAVLLSFLLAPLCARLERWGLGRVLSVITVTMLSFIVIFVIGWVVAGQILDLAGKLPLYQDNIRAKIQSLELPSSGPLGRATRGIREFTREISEAQKQNDELNPLDVGEDAENADPVPVRVVPNAMRPMQTLMAAATPLLGPLASAGIVIVFVIFILLQRDELRDRVLRLIGQGRLTIATQAIDDAASRVSRFLLAQFIVNATYGLAAAVGLFFIGVPNAMLWGVLATLLRFIPYVGPWLGALLPIGLSLAVFDSWTPVLFTAGLFVVIELISNNIMEPLLYGSRTGVSPVAILMSAVFWAWLWGPVGLVLATPLTVCVVVMGRYIPRLEFLSVLLSDQPGLSPAARMYQRLLAMDQDDVFDIANEFLGEHSVVELYEQVLVPALALAERDRHHDRMDSAREQAVYDTMRDLIEDLMRRPVAEDEEAQAAADQSKQDDADEAASVEENPKEALASTQNAENARSVICVPARDVGDEISGMMLVHVLRLEGFRAELVPPGLLVTEMLNFLEERQPDGVCISALPPQAVVRTRHLCQRLVERFADLRLVIGFWNVSDLAPSRERLDMCSPDRIVATLSDAVNHLRS